MNNKDQIVGYCKLCGRPIYAGDKQIECPNGAIHSLKQYYLDNGDKQYQ